MKALFLVFFCFGLLSSVYAQEELNNRLKDTKGKGMNVTQAQEEEADEEAIKETEEKPKKRKVKLYRDKKHRYGTQTYGPHYRPKLWRMPKTKEVTSPEGEE